MQLLVVACVNRIVSTILVERGSELRIVIQVQLDAARHAEDPLETSACRYVSQVMEDIIRSPSQTLVPNAINLCMCKLVRRGRTRIRIRLSRR